MRKKALAIAVASALVAPTSFAATDTSGMRYTSASEGFYGSIRARYRTNAGEKDTGGTVESGFSRVGVRGTHDLGGGLTGSYQWELGVNITDGTAAGDTRLGNVGLSGDFGALALGSFWTFDYGATHGSTDQANTHSGFFNYTLDREGRSERAIQYTSPDLNGFQGALLLSFKNSPSTAVTGSDAVASDAGFCINNETGAITATSGNPMTCPMDTTTRISGTAGAAAVTALRRANSGKDDNAVDSWNLAGQYSIQGATVGASYNVRPDGLIKVSGIRNASGNIAAGGIASVATEDAKSWTIRGSYGQDNWNVNAWYGVDNTSDSTDTTGLKLKDQTFLELHAGVALDKTNLYAIYANRGDSEGKGGMDDTYTTVGAQYNLSDRSRTWIEYVSQSYDTKAANDDYLNIGLRFDF